MIDGTPKHCQRQIVRNMGNVTDKPKPETEEAVPVDDAVMGRGTLVPACAGVAGGRIFSRLENIRFADEVPAEPHLEIRCSDRALPECGGRAGRRVHRYHRRRQGITFVHNNGARDEDFLRKRWEPACIFDYDGDGNQDLLFVNGTGWLPDNPDLPTKKPTTLALYHNDGHGHFTDVTAGSGLDVPAAWASPSAITTTMGRRTSLSPA